MASRSLGHRAPLLWLVLPLIGGLVGGKCLPIPQCAWLLAGALSAAAMAFFCAITASPRATPLWSGGLVVAMLLAGAASYTLHRARLRTWDVLPPREVRLSLRVDRVFGQVDLRRASGLATVTAPEEHVRELAGQRLYFSLNLGAGEAVPIRSAIISTRGVLVTLPPNPAANTFDGYLAGAGMNFKLTRGRILAVVQPANAYYRFCADAAARCHLILGRGIADKRPLLAGLLRAMMLGATRELSEEQQTLFMQSGTMHLFAISGLNIGVIASALQALLLLFRLPAWSRFLLGAALLWLFVDITGAAPSAVRAFGMWVFLQAAMVLRRPANLLAALILSALTVLLIAPLQIFSASFLMSYAIVTALLLLGLPLAEAWLAQWSPWRDLPQSTWNAAQRAVFHGWRATASAVAVGIATSLVGLLTGVQFFNLLTPGSLLANLILIPAAVIVTLGGFGSLLCGLVGIGAAATLCNHAAALVLGAIQELVRLSVQLPGAFVPASFSNPWTGPIALMVLIAALLGGYAANWERRGGSWWPPFLIVAIVLMLGVNYSPM